MFHNHISAVYLISHRMFHNHISAVCLIPFAHYISQTLLIRRTWHLVLIRLGFVYTCWNGTRGAQIEDESSFGDGKQNVITRGQQSVVTLTARVVRRRENNLRRKDKTEEDLVCTVPKGINTCSSYWKLNLQPAKKISKECSTTFTLW